ncbi:MAG: helix-turn-helix domain-containing protein [Candidatus Acidiferrales bacterium]
MNRSVPIETEARESADSENSRSTQGNCHVQADTPRLVACLLLLPENSEHIFELFQKLATRNPDLPAHRATTDTEVPKQPRCDDPWLSHSEAAAYLGVSKSTLYHYSCLDEIERRKLGGRLEYRRSVLDEFKRAHTLPASCHSTSARIIPSAHSSGK